MNGDDKIKCVKPDCDEEWNGVGTHQLCERCYNEWASNYFPIKDTRKPLVTYKDDEAGTELQVFEDDVPCRVADFFKAVSSDTHPADDEHSGWATERQPIDKECETSIRITDRMSLVTPAHPDECVYVRLVMDGEWEVAYWHWTEWQRDSTEVMGAIVGALNAQQVDEEQH